MMTAIFNRYSTKGRNNERNKFLLNLFWCSRHEPPLYRVLANKAQIAEFKEYEALCVLRRVLLAKGFNHGQSHHTAVSVYPPVSGGRAHGTANARHVYPVCRRLRLPRASSRRREHRLDYDGSHVYKFPILFRAW